MATDDNYEMPGPEYWEAKMAEIPPDVLSKAVSILQDEWSEEDKDLLRTLYKEYGPHEWIHEGFKETFELNKKTYTISNGHHGWGMQVRNLLREKGIKDDLFPDGIQPAASTPALAGR